jgi:5'-deoxynucleotidase YfbR-like HD superfamily hydrolase
MARKPDPALAAQTAKLAKKLEAVTKTAQELRAAEGKVDVARDRFRKALREAHAAGASHAFLGRLLGLSRQRVAQLLEP